MSALATPSPVSPKDARGLTPRKRENRVAPVVAAIDGSTAGWHATDAAVRLALELNAPLTFVYVRSGPAGFFGTPVFERRLTRKMLEARRVIDLAVSGAARSGVEAEGEILEGSPRKRIVQFARDRSARLIVIGSRRRRLGRSVSCAVVRAARRPVLVCAAQMRLLTPKRSIEHLFPTPVRNLVDPLARRNNPWPSLQRQRVRPAAPATHTK